MIISCIVAKSTNNIIGKDNQMPWHISADLMYFKKVTSGHTIILGRKNFESIGRALPNRTNIIVTKNKSFKCSSCIVLNSLEKALQHAFEHNEDEVFIIGGGQIYEQTKEYWDRLYITQINEVFDGDVYFPEIDMKKWVLTSQECFEKSEINKFNYCFNVYNRKEPR